MRDDTIKLFREGYAFIGRRCDALGVDAFVTRIALQRTICMRGEEAARLISDPTKFVRRGAAPRRMTATLLGRGGVQALDGGAHHHRKAMFVDLLGPARIESLIDAFGDGFRRAIPYWSSRRELIFFDELQLLLCEVVCRWAGVPLSRRAVRRRTQDFAAMIEGAGRLAIGYLEGRAARKRAERWAARLIRATRRGRLAPPDTSVLAVIANHHDGKGKQLAARIAAVELLNVLRPTVAVARYIVFAMVALEQHPQWRQRIADGDDALPFVQEVRRVTPFFPFVAARARHAFHWHGLQFTPGMRVLLDLYGTNHHLASWPAPNAFHPERFMGKEPSAYGFIPQGPGEHRQHHRCPGEWATIGIMSRAVELLCREMSYEVPAQDLTVDLGKVPALPHSRLRLRGIAPVTAASARPSATRGASQRPAGRP